MTVHIAADVIRAIETAIERDQGAAYRGWLGKVIPHIGDAYRTDEDGFRSHMGASQIGDECARKIWYNFRWVTKKLFDGRMIRLFNRGHLEEARFIAQLLTVGVEVFQQDANGKQFRISFGDDHGGGSGDGVGVNVPGLQPGIPCLLEFKTHGAKSFAELAGKNWRKYVEGILKGRKVAFDGNGVKEAKPEHYVQMNTYMRKMGIPIALYGAVCKDTDDVYWELVPLDPETADMYIDRGEKLIYLVDPPKRLSESPGFFKCGWCDHKPVCHLRAEPNLNCRTCKFSEPVPGGEWLCRMRQATVDKQTQLTGCPSYERNPVI